MPNDRSFVGAVRESWPKIKEHKRAESPYDDGHDDEPKDPAPPCGSCRQTMSEFAPDLKVTAYSKNGKQVTWQLSELLPEAFALNYLRGKE